MKDSIKKDYGNDAEFEIINKILVSGGEEIAINYYVKINGEYKTYQVRREYETISEEIDNCCC